MNARTRTTARTVPGGLVIMALLASFVVAAWGVSAAEPAAAQCAPSLYVSKTNGLAAGGETVTVSGNCYDEFKGVYVAFCVVPPPGATPSPCGGGVDMSGAGGLSHWISSNPPPAGVGLAAPYGPGGSFTVTMTPSATLNASIDCRRVSCAIVTRNDHTRSSDRSQDVIIPVTFAADPAPTTAPPVFVPPPPAEVTTTTAPPETTTTLAPVEETTTTTVEVQIVTDTTVAAEADEELAATTASSDGGSSGSGGLVVIVVVALVLVAGAVSGWFVLRRRSQDVGGGA